MPFLCKTRTLLGLLCAALDRDGGFRPDAARSRRRKSQPPPRSGKESRRRSTNSPKPQKAISGPAGNPECVWLGRRVVSLLWRDDLDTAFRHLDLYDRFGCPSAHIQATFRCLILHGSNIDPKAADSLNGRVHACWINPARGEPPPPRPRPNPAPKG